MRQQWLEQQQPFPRGVTREYLGFLMRLQQLEQQRPFPLGATRSTQDSMYALVVLLEY